MSHQREHIDGLSSSKAKAILGFRESMANTKHKKPVCDKYEASQELFSDEEISSKMRNPHQQGPWQTSHVWI